MKKMKDFVFKAWAGFTDGRISKLVKHSDTTYDIYSNKKAAEYWHNDVRKVEIREV